MLLYYITDRAQFPGDEKARQSAMLEKIREAAGCGIDLIQLREKDLPACELEILCREAVSIVRSAEGKTRLLVNSRTDIALACNADGVHIPSAGVAPSLVRTIWKQAGKREQVILSVSCHSAADVALAAAERADFAVFAPVFEKRSAPNASPTGLRGLGEACRETIPIFALGGVTCENAHTCRDAGAAGIAAIRLFQENNIAEAVRVLRAL